MMFLLALFTVYGPPKSLKTESYGTNVLYGPRTVYGPAMTLAAEQGSTTNVKYGPAHENVLYGPRTVYGPAMTLAAENGSTTPSETEYFHIMIFVPLPHTGEGPQLVAVDPHLQTEDSPLLPHWGDEQSPSFICGGFSNERPANEWVQSVVTAVNTDVEKRCKKEFAALNAISYISQVVAGTIYIVKVKADDEYFHLKIFDPLPGSGETPSLLSMRTASEFSPLVPF